MVIEMDLSTHVGSEWEIAKCVTYCPWGDPDSVLMTGHGADPPLVWVVISDTCCLVPWAAVYKNELSLILSPLNLIKFENSPATVQKTFKVGAWCSDITVVWT